MKTYYKLVSQDLKSAIMSQHKDLRELEVQYKINEWTNPNIDGSLLMVFDSIDNVKRFVHKKPRYRLFICEISGISKIPIFRSFYKLPKCIASLKKVWKARKSKKKFSNIVNTHSSPPKGTVFCSKVKLVEEVTNW